jgi:hypothetical protein
MGSFSTLEETAHPPQNHRQVNPLNPVRRAALVGEGEDAHYRLLVGQEVRSARVAKVRL